MGFSSLTRNLGLTLAFIALTSVSASAQNRSIDVDIDGNMWRMVRDAEHCTNRVEAAIEFYEKEPLFNTARAASGDRFLVDESSECWVELSIEGVSDVSFIFKVSPDQIVVDQRGLNWWGYKVFPYPTEPYEQ